VKHQLSFVLKSKSINITVANLVENKIGSSDKMLENNDQNKKRNVKKRNSTEMKPSKTVQLVTSEEVTATTTLMPEGTDNAVVDAQPKELAPTIAEEEVATPTDPMLERIDEVDNSTIEALSTEPTSAESQSSVDHPTIEALEPLNLNGYSSPKVTGNSPNPRNGAGVISIVYTEKSGKRIMLSDKVNTHLNNPVSVQIAFSNEKMIISEKLPSINGDYHPRLSGRKMVIYSTPLVDECIERYNLDYTDRTTITFYDADYGISTSGPFVSIKMNY